MNNQIKTKLLREIRHSIYLCCPQWPEYLMPEVKVGEQISASRVYKVIKLSTFISQEANSAEIVKICLSNSY